MPERYDVIIIGTGAGGGTLAHTLASSGKKILILERGNFLPREMDNWNPAPRVRRRSLHLPRHVVRRFGQGVPAASALLRRRRHEAVRRRALPAATAGFRRAEARRRRLAGVAAHLRRLRAVLHEGRVALSGARQPRRRPDRRPLEQAVPVARGVARAAHPAGRRRLGEGRLPPVPRAVRRAAGRGRAGQEHVHSLHMVRRLPVPRAREVGRGDDRGAADHRPSERHVARRRRSGAARNRCIRS